MTPIGIIHSCFKEKFGIPRQPGLVPEARATLELYPPYGSAEALAGLEGFSHLWVIFVFHQALQQNAGIDAENSYRGQWQPSVRPPRLGGNQKVGVFASRSPFRPNPIGLSAVKLESIDCLQAPCYLHLSGVDFLDGTPVLDIKPYVPYADAVPQARAGFAAAAPVAEAKVRFSSEAEVECEKWEVSYPGLRQLIVNLLRLDPRPAYKSGQGNDSDDRIYGMRLHDVDVRWQISGEVVTVVELHYPNQE